MDNGRGSSDLANVMDGNAKEETLGNTLVLTNWGHGGRMMGNRVLRLGRSMLANMGAGGE